MRSGAQAGALKPATRARGEPSGPDESMCVATRAGPGVRMATVHLEYFHEEDLVVDERAPEA